MSSAQELDFLKIPIQDIKSATNDFSVENFIGRGGFGSVYKGQLPLPASATSSSNPVTTVAIKRLNMKGGQGHKEFYQEIFMLSNYKHKNLVSLIGFCEDVDEKIIVYELAARGSLDKYLATTDITWVQRLSICLGVARGLDFLHNGVGEGHRVLHRDIKSANVLLDENWDAMLSDFGLAKIGVTNQKFTFIATNPAGTEGYIDPLYVKNRMFTKESDVYSFGVVLFEVLCGTPAQIGKDYLSRLAEDCYEKGKLDAIIAPNLRKQMRSDSLLRFSSIAYQCLKLDPKQRPTVGLIIRQLQTSLEYQIGLPRSIQIGYWGSYTGGGPWSLRLETHQKLRKIIIDHSGWIYSLRFSVEEYGSLHSSIQYGGAEGKPGNLCEINLEDDEEITGIYGTTGATTWPYGGAQVIYSLAFVTNKRTHGHYGKPTKDTFSVGWDAGFFAGFYGRSGFYLDGIGCYLKALSC